MWKGSMLKWGKNDIITGANAMKIIKEPEG